MIYYYIIIYKINKYKTINSSLILNKIILIFAKIKNIKLKLFRVKFDISNINNKFQIPKIFWKARQKYFIKYIHQMYSQII